MRAGCRLVRSRSPGRRSIPPRRAPLFKDRKQQDGQVNVRFRSSTTRLGLNGAGRAGLGVCQLRLSPVCTPIDRSV